LQFFWRHFSAAFFPPKCHHSKNISLKKYNQWRRHIVMCKQFQTEEYRRGSLQFFNFPLIPHTSCWIQNCRTYLYFQIRKYGTYFFGIFPDSELWDLMKKWKNKTPFLSTFQQLFAYVFSGFFRSSLDGNIVCTLQEVFLQQFFFVFLGSFSFHRKLSKK
jgi:hypothetical protein